MSDGGADDPCALNNNNDANDGLDKDPSLCVNGDTFFLWDEPDTQVNTRRYRLIEPRVGDWPYQADLVQVQVSTNVVQCSE